MFSSLNFIKTRIGQVWKSDIFDESFYSVTVASIKFHFFGDFVSLYGISHF